MCVFLVLDCATRPRLRHGRDVEEQATIQVPCAHLCDIGRPFLFLSLSPVLGRACRGDRLCLNKAASDEIIWHCKPRAEQTVSASPTDPCTWVIKICRCSIRGTTRGVA